MQPLLANMMKTVSALLFTLFALTACSNEPSYLSPYHGKWIVLNYWASWCKPCWEEMPQLNAFYKQYQQKNIVVLGVNYDSSETAELAATIKKMNIQFPVLPANPQHYFGIKDIPGLPMTYIINPQGKVFKILPGEQTVKTLQDALGLS